MDIAYENFARIIAEKGLTPYRIAKDTGLTTVLFTDWKKGKSRPKIDKMEKIAKYLNVSVDYLLGKSNDPKPVTVKVGSSAGREIVISGYDDLNDEGRELVADYVSSLRRKPRYVKAAVPTKTVIKRPDGTILVPVRGTPVIEYKGKAMSAKTVVRPKIKKKKKTPVKV